MPVTHKPAGSPEGGQFAPGDSRRSATPEPEMYEHDERLDAVQDRWGLRVSEQVEGIDDDEIRDATHEVLTRLDSGDERAVDEVARLAITQLNSNDTDKALASTALDYACQTRAKELHHASGHDQSCDEDNAYDKVGREFRDAHLGKSSKSLVCSCPHAEVEQRFGAQGVLDYKKCNDDERERMVGYYRDIQGMDYPALFKKASDDLPVDANDPATTREAFAKSNAMYYELANRAMADGHASDCDAVDADSIRIMNKAEGWSDPVPSCTCGKPGKNA